MPFVTSDCQVQIIVGPPGGRQATFVTFLSTLTKARGSLLQEIASRLCTSHSKEQLCIEFPELDPDIFVHILNYLRSGRVTFSHSTPESTLYMAKEHASALRLTGLEWKLKRLFAHKEEKHNPFIVETEHKDLQDYPPIQTEVQPELQSVELSCQSPDKKWYIGHSPSHPILSEVEISTYTREFGHDDLPHTPHTAPMFEDTKEGDNNSFECQFDLDLEVDDDHSSQIQPFSLVSDFEFDILRRYSDTELAIML